MGFSLNDLTNPFGVYDFLPGVNDANKGAKNTRPPYNPYSEIKQNLPPDPMLTLLPFMESMMGAMSEFSATAISSLSQLNQIPEMPEPFQAPFRDWESERNKLKDLIQRDPAATPRRGRASTVLTSLLDRDESDTSILHGSLTGAP